MARARNIKPSLFKNELLGEADPLLTILFTGLWCLADRDGKLEDRPRRIQAEIFPYRDLPLFNGYLTELQRLGFIDRYTVGNVSVIKVCNFEKHQSPHKTEKHSDLPEPPLKSDSCIETEVAPLNNGSPTVKESLIPDSLIPDSLIIPPDKSDGYVFCGGTIKLNQDDYSKLLERYQNLDVPDQLQQLDLELRGKKNWFVEMNSKLNYRNKTPTYQKSSKGSTRAATLHDDLTDTSWARQ